MPENASEIIDFAFNVKSVADAKELIRRLEPHASMWNYVGDIATNQGAINIYENPAYALVERVTNSFDGIIDLEMLRNPVSALSPNQAVSIIFGIESLSSLSVNDPLIKAISSRISIELTDSGNKDRPTVIVADDGIGIHPDEARTTILSLHGENKKGKFYLHGMFGQGGSGTFASCDISVIISRQASEALDGKEDLIGITVVKKTHEDHEQLPSYKYLCSADLNIASLPPSSETEFKHGVTVIHIGYDIGRLARRPVYDNSGFINFLGQRMFDPVLPVTIIGSRTNPSDLFKGEKLSRISRGLPFRLNRKLRGRPRAVHKDEISMSLDRGMGEVKVRLWVVHWPEGIHKTAKSARESFLPPNSEPILFTNSGQTIESLSSAWFRREVEFGLVSEGIVMDISLDNLDHKVKASLVGGNRKMVRNQVYDEIVAHIVDRLRKDEKLKRIEDEFRNRRVVREIIDAELIRRLGELIDTQIKIPSGSVRITGSGGAKVGGSDESELPRENDLPLLPTRIICEPPQIMLHQGSSKSFTIDIDAKEGLLDQEGNNLELVWEGDTSGITTSRGALKNGRIGCHVKAGPGVVTGERTLTVRLVLAERTLENSISVEVKEPEHKSKKKQVRKVKSPPRGPNIQWVFEEDWPEHDWDAYDIGKTEFSPDSTTIFLNRHSEICKEYADSAIDKTERAIVRRENEWILRVGFGVFKIHYYNDKVLAEGSDRMTDEQMTLSKRVLAEAIATSVR